VPHAARPTVTLHDVAAAAGVSLSTASRVLGGSSRTVAPEYEQRVLAAAAELRYTADASARAMRRASDAITLLADDLTTPSRRPPARRARGTSRRCTFDRLHHQAPGRGGDVPRLPGQQRGVGERPADRTRRAGEPEDPGGHQPKLSATDKAAIDYLDSLKVGEAPRVTPKGASSIETILGRHTDDALFGRATPDAAANAFISQLQQEIDSA
jgi:hypothetical protein